ncbi:MAG: hypothetical protein LBM08_02430 [Dysgonamonadaceae bacterium]|jgi:hypothetical protein|nr:hypothetical protein [Dysgonamonadaceae bacterium]
MKEKEKIQLEYVFNKISKNILWNYLTAPSGLSEWFADEVSVDEDRYFFTWAKNTQEAKKTGIANLSFIRFKWLDEDADIYFEFKINTTEVTGSIVLEITDFIDPDEREESINLWESQVKVLKRSLGI